MMNKGGFSFVAMLVINPIVILFYQNCSMSPISHAKNRTPPQSVSITRQVASEVQAAKADIKKPECNKENKTSNCSKTE